MKEVSSSIKNVNLVESTSWEKLLQNLLNYFQQVKLPTTNSGLNTTLDDVVSRLDLQLGEDKKLDISQTEVREKPACKWLDEIGQAIDYHYSGRSYSSNCSSTQHVPEGYSRNNLLTQLLKDFKGQLDWRHGYSNLSEHLFNKYAYTELVGPDAPICIDDISVGLVLLAPYCEYPEHRHGQISEVYVNLFGQVEINNEVVLVPDTVKYIQEEETHKLETGETPTLLLYAWLGNDYALQDKENLFKFS